MPMTDVGHTRRTGPPSCAPESRQTSASNCTVLPRPMSSARHPPSPHRCRNDSHEYPRSWYGRSTPANPSGAGTSSIPALSSSASSTPAILPSALMPPNSSPPGTSPAPSAIRMTCPTRTRPDCLLIKSMADWMSEAFTATHCPRIRTSGVFSPASLSSSSPESGWPPRATSQSNRTTVSSVSLPPPPCMSRTRARAATLDLVPLPVHHLGSIIPYPACWREAASLVRNSYAPASSVAWPAGLASSDPANMPGHTPEACPSDSSRNSLRLEPLRSSSDAPAAPSQTSSAGTRRLGSSCGWSRYLTYQEPEGSPSPGSSRRKQRRNPKSADAVTGLCHSAMLAASWGISRA